MGSVFYLHHIARKYAGFLFAGATLLIFLSTKSRLSKSNYDFDNFENMNLNKLKENLKKEKYKTLNLPTNAK